MSTWAERKAAEIRRDWDDGIDATVDAFRRLIADTIAECARVCEAERAVWGAESSQRLAVGMCINRIRALMTEDEEASDGTNR